MKKMIAFLGLSIVFLAGCTARGPSVSVDPGGIYPYGYDGGGYHRGGGGRFCPPGQAKKGNC
ncbi:hypothetical protein [Advenella mimigardefordensis]|uniref:Putative lipoprotein n=1 Tax=Advenella mimigardefordensis (strain DSM 17166 / LMG 22922 / DPN7) TaxID=1247726 RepID=W0PEH7_ADVMD|nr:hypothetical protein [Advenella mimigardefordensis]AHG63453.1 putative lipoprotein [Advenella mimigardefordensis DPN7]